MALENIRVLLVEDDPVFRRLVADFLDSRGAQITEADDGVLGLAQFKLRPFDVVLADLSMPNMGGLDMLRAIYLLDPSISSIVISAGGVMADVVEALRIGASDYLVKPLDDLFVIEQSIRDCLQLTEPATSFENSSAVDSQLSGFDELTRAEFEDNLRLLNQNAEAARHLQQQLFPASEVQYPKACLQYGLFKHEDVSAFFIDSTMVGASHLVFYMAHFHPENNQAALASVLLRSLVNHKLKAFRNGQSQTVIEPFTMLGYLNERLLKSGLNITADIIYIVVELTHYRAAIAKAGQGLRCYIRNQEGLTPLALAETLQLGLLEWSRPSSQFRTLSPGESLCIATSAPAHRSGLIQNQFDGLVCSQAIPAGGYVQVSF